MTVLRLLLGAALALVPMLGQELPGGRDFLTDYEIEVLRGRQGFNERIEAYVKFARLRLELIEQTLEAEEPGRAANIHRTLQEYASIIEAVDDVIDDALARNRKVDDALQGLLEAEQRFLARLGAVKAQAAADSWRYEFVLEDALDITRDSIELLAADLGERKRNVLLQDERDRKRQLESMAPERRKEAERQDRQEAAEKSERTRKRPTLLRPGEKLDDK